MKRYLVIAMALALIVLLPVAAGWSRGQAQTPAPTPSPTPAPTGGQTSGALRTITVVGQASVRVEPDIAHVTIGVETRADTVAEATQQNEDTMNDVLAALEEAGIAAADIQTSQFSIQFNRTPPVPEAAGETQPGQESVPRFTVINTVNVTVRDLEAAGQVLDAAVEAGANNVYGISFTVEDPDVVRAQARADAVADARARAEDLAELGGVELGAVLSMSEIVGGGPGPGLAEIAQDGITSIRPGQVELSYQVQVVFSIAP